MTATLEQYLEKAIGDLPTIPAVAARVMKAIEDTEAGADDIRALIDQDPALVARILKVANSALYGFAREIQSLRHAIALMGLRTVRNLVLGASMKQTYKRFGLMEKLLWEHSTLAGPMAAKLAALPAIQIDPEDAFVAGLLHDVGKTALSNSHRDEYEQVVARIYNERISFVQAEREAFGFDHAELGARVAQEWKLPQALVSTIRNHHAPESWADMDAPAARLTALASLSTACLTKLGVGRREPVDELVLTETPAWRFFGMAADQVEPVLALAAEQVELGQALLQ